MADGHGEGADSAVEGVSEDLAASVAASPAVVVQLEGGKITMIDRLIHFILRFRLLWLLLILFLTIFMGWRATKIPFDLSVAMFRMSGDPDVEYTQQFNQEFGDLASHIFGVLIHAPSGITPELLQSMKRITEATEKVPGIAQVLSISNIDDIYLDGDSIVIGPLLKTIPNNSEEITRLEERILQNPLMKGRILTEDKQYLGLSYRFHSYFQKESEQRETMETIEKIMNQELGSKYKAYFIGIPYIQKEYSKLINQGLVLAQAILTIACLVILYLFFKNWILATLPLIISGISVIITIGLMEQLGYAITLISSAVPTLIMVNSVAESTYYISCYLEERGNGLDRRGALIQALKSVFTASVASSITTVLGFFSLYSSKLTKFQDFGVNLGLGALIGFIVTLLTVPTLLWWIPISNASIESQKETGGVPRFMAWISRCDVNHPKSVLAFWFLLLVITVIGLPRLHVEQYVTQEVGPEHSIRKTQTLFFEKAWAPLAVMSIHSTQPGAWENPETLEKVKAIQKKIESYKGFKKAWSVVDYLEQMNWVFFDGKTQERRIPSSERLAALYYELIGSSESAFEAKSLINSDHSWGAVLISFDDVGNQVFINFTEEVESWASKLLGPEFEVRFVGNTIIETKGSMRLINEMLRSFVTSFLTVFVVMFFALRSFRMILIAIPVNVLPLLLVLGLMGLFGIGLRIGTATILPIGLGIAVNDTIHLFIRYRHELKRGLSPADAIRASLVGTGRGMLTSSAVLCIGILAMLTSEFIAIQHFGIGTSLALFLALLADLLLGPVLLLKFIGNRKRSGIE